MERVSEILWGPWLVYPLLGLGAVVTVLTLAVQIRELPRAIGLLRARNHPAGARRQLRTLVGASTGMGAIAGAAAALALGGPGAVFWIWVATALGMAIHFAEGTLAAAARRDAGSDQPFAHVAGLRLVGKPLALLIALLAAIAALAAGGLFQAHQGASLLRTTLHIQPMAGAIALAVVSAPLVLAAKLRHRLVMLVPISVGLYVLACAIVLAGDTWGVYWALGEIWTQAFSYRPAVGGVVGVAMTAALHQGAVRATFAGEAGLGSAALAGADDDRSPADVGRTAMLAPLVSAGIVATLTALVVMVVPESDSKSPIDRRVVPLERHESRGLRPSELGQTIILPTDTKLERANSYRMVVRANPRGHRLGQLLKDENAVAMPLWGIAKDTDTIVLHDKDKSRAQNPGWDLRIPCNREIVEAPNGAQFLKLVPKDPGADIKQMIRGRQLDGPFVVFSDYEFVGRVGNAMSPDPELGEHLAMVEDRKRDAPLNPKLHELFRTGYRGPYVADDQERPPWALVTNEGYEPAVNGVVRLRLQSPARGSELATVAFNGALEVPPWDFLLGTRQVVLRHTEDPALDIHVPVRADLFRGRARLVSLDPGFEDFRVVENMEHYVGPFVLAPPYDFAVEVHSGTRLPEELRGRRALVALHDRGEPHGPEPELPYRPHPGEVLQTDMVGPTPARDGVATVVEQFDVRLGGLGRWMFLLAALLLVLTTLAISSELGARSFATLAGAASATAFRVLFVIAVACAALFEFGQVLALADAAIAALAIVNVAALFLLVPRLRSEIGAQSAKKK